MDDLRTKFGAMSHEERKVASREREIRGDQVLLQRNSHYKSANWSPDSSIRAKTLKRRSIARARLVDWSAGLI